MLRIFVVGFIGSIMLVLAVMASYELTKDVPEIPATASSPQTPNASPDVDDTSRKVTQDNAMQDKSIKDMAQNTKPDTKPNSKNNTKNIPEPTPHVPKDNAKADSIDVSMQAKSATEEGSIVPLDNGTVRTDTKTKVRQLPTLPVETIEEDAAKQQVKPEAKPANTSPMPNVPPAFLQEKVNDLPKPDIASPPQSTRNAVPQKKNLTQEDDLVVMVTNAPLRKAPHESIITRVRLEVGPRRVALRFIGEKPLAARSFTLNDPERFVLDLQGTWALELPRIPKNALLRDLRIGRPEGVTRIVLDLLKKPIQADVVQINPKTIEIRLY